MSVVVLFCRNLIAKIRISFPSPGGLTVSNQTLSVDLPWVSPQVKGLGDVVNYILCSFINKKSQASKSKLPSKLNSQYSTLSNIGESHFIRIIKLLLIFVFEISVAVLPSVGKESRFFDPELES
jgi:hypothetical protein